MASALSKWHPQTVPNYIYIIDYIIIYLRAAAPAADPGKKKVAEDIITERTGY